MIQLDSDIFSCLRMKIEKPKLYGMAITNNGLNFFENALKTYLGGSRQSYKNSFPKEEFTIIKKTCRDKNGIAGLQSSVVSDLSIWERNYEYGVAHFTKTKLTETVTGLPWRQTEADDVLVNRNVETFRFSAATTSRTADISKINLLFPLDCFHKFRNLDRYVFQCDNALIFIDAPRVHFLLQNWFEIAQMSERNDIEERAFSCVNITGNRMFKVSLGVLNRISVPRIFGGDSRRTPLLDVVMVNGDGLYSFLSGETINTQDYSDYSWRSFEMRAKKINYPSEVLDKTETRGFCVYRQDGDSIIRDFYGSLKESVVAMRKLGCKDSQNALEHKSYHVSDAFEKVARGGQIPRRLRAIAYTGGVFFIVHRKHEYKQVMPRLNQIFCNWGEWELRKCHV